MAIWEFTPHPFADGVVKEKTWWGEVYSGTFDALVTAGLLKPEWRPGGPGNGKRTQHVLIDSSGCRLMSWGEAKRRRDELSEQEQLLRISLRGRNLIDLWIRRGDYTYCQEEHRISLLSTCSIETAKFLIDSWIEQDELKRAELCSMPGGNYLGEVHAWLRDSARRTSTNLVLRDVDDGKAQDASGDPGGFLKK